MTDPWSKPAHELKLLGACERAVVVFAPRVRCAVVVGAVRRVVQLAHAAVGEVVHVAAQDGHEERREEQQHERRDARDGEAPAEQPRDGRIEQLVARRISAEVGVVDDVLHRGEGGSDALFRLSGRRSGRRS